MRRRLVAIGLVVALAAGAGAQSDTPSITWDRWGVPHVDVPATGTRIQQLHALGVAFGYATARDRLYQLEIGRRAVTGRLSELPFATGLYSRDVVVRRDGLTDAERTAAIRRLPGHLRILVRAYAEGVN